MSIGMLTMKLFFKEHNRKSLSPPSPWGGTRIFQLRQKEGKEPTHEVFLHDGDICTMEGYCQKFYMHRIPQDTGERSRRINLTWRWIVKHQEGCAMNGQAEHLLLVVKNRIITRTPRIWDGEVKRTTPMVRRPTRPTSRTPSKVSWREVKTARALPRRQTGTLKWLPKDRT